MSVELPGAASCADCGSTRLRRLGPLPDVAFFAGQRLESALPGGVLMHCAACDLRFRHPALAADDYDRLYDNPRIDAWTSAELRRDQRLVRSFVEAESRVRGQPMRVLDFGCYAGQFLASLPAQVERFGVEVNAAAAAYARQQSGARVERELRDFAADLRFDVIVAMDVIEHVASPRDLLSHLRARLAPCGVLIVTTGDGANWLWRLLGARWWYCYFPEHIAFISRRWLRYHAPAQGVYVRQATRFNYLDDAQRSGFVTRWKAMLRYLLRPAAHARRQQRHAARHGSDLGVPGIGLTRDHLLVALGSGGLLEAAHRVYDIELLKQLRGRRLAAQLQVLCVIGAHRFDELPLVNRLFPALRHIYLFEPLEGPLAALRRLAEQDPRIRVFPVAISERDGTAAFHVTSNDGESSSLLRLGTHRELFPEVEVRRTIEVPTRQLDSVLAEHRLPAPDALLIDVQGAEYQVLRALSAPLLAQVRLIYTEVSTERVYESAGLLADVESLLEGRFVNLGYAPLRADVAVHGNAVFVARDDVGDALELTRSERARRAFHRARRRVRTAFARTAGGSG